MKKALVTGASSGIGYAIAKKLAQNGCSVVITGRNITSLKRVSDELGENVFPIVWDVMELGKADEMIIEIAAMLNGLDIVVNNAGIFAQRNEWNKADLLNTTVREWSDVINTNSSALFFIMKSAVNYMLNNNI